MSVTKNNSKKSFKHSNFLYSVQKAPAVAVEFLRLLENIPALVKIVEIEGRHTVVSSKTVFFVSSTYFGEMNLVLFRFGEIPPKFKQNGSLFYHLDLAKFRYAKYFIWGEP